MTDLDTERWESEHAERVEKFLATLDEDLRNVLDKAWGQKRVVIVSVRAVAGLEPYLRFQVGSAAYAIPPKVRTLPDLIHHLGARGRRDNRPFNGSPGWTVGDAEAYDLAAEALEEYIATRRSRSIIVELPRDLYRVDALEWLPNLEPFLGKRVRVTVELQLEGSS